MKNTALTQTHLDLGAKMVPFAGYNMPIQYEGLKVEHLNVRSGVGVFDVSHMGEFFVEGPHAMDLIQKVTSNDVAVLIDGQVQYSCMPNLDGGIVDDLLVYRIHSEKYMLVVNASNIEKDFNWINQFNDKKVSLTNKSDDYSLLAVQGPKAVEALQPLTDIDLSDMKYYTFKIGEFCGIKDVIISATGYTGAGGFEVYFFNEHANTIWNSIFESGKDLNIMPIGLAARDTLRLEMGFCLYGNDIDDTTSPLEAGLGWITKFTNDFNNSADLLEQKENGLSKRRVGFVMQERGIPRKDYSIVDDNGNAIGVVSSGTMSPSLDKAIGMGYVKKEFSKVGTEVFIQIRNKQLKAKVVKLPFYKA
ncbi:MAG: glycine cleavage system aminomethyltransferase GcvT [Flavobacteriales bacterium]|nr:glycine cleavage system aminomethyltransferase GcvT [Flavobacteriales bacterium]